MNNVWLAVSMAVGLSVVTVVADLLIKKASMHKDWNGWLMLILGALIYGFTALGWFFVMRKVKLSTLGVVYAISCVLMLTCIGVFYFKEKINMIEAAGIALAVMSLLMLSRFA